jgi:hypothetical protein
MRADKSGSASDNVFHGSAHMAGIPKVGKIVIPEYYLINIDFYNLNYSIL